MSVTRIVEVKNITPQELAYFFTEMYGEQQAEFFSEIWKIAKQWPGAGWYQQSLGICKEADSDALSAIQVLAEHYSAIKGVA